MTAPTCDVLFHTKLKIDGVYHWLTVYPAGLTLHFRPGRGRLVGWPEVVDLADGPPADRFGVVVDGRLVRVCDQEAEANDRAADQRQIGSAATVIRVPQTLPD
ncbi:MAG: hypothetical protein JWO38_4448 [Gemmataceae bacterium]|nr:hypothetical protein [Gemmataceae bacterium]